MVGDRRMRKDLESVARRKAVAEENARARAERSPSQQLALLNEKLGDGEGAVRERARLQRLIEHAPERRRSSPAAPSPRPRPKMKAKERRRKGSAQETRKQKKARLQSERDRAAAEGE